jgi:hypothetical protein
VELLALAGEGASLQVDAAAAAEISRIESGLAEADSDRDRFFARLLVGFTHLADDPEVAMVALHQAIDYAGDETRTPTCCSLPVERLSMSVTTGPRSISTDECLSGLDESRPWAVSP